MDFSRQASGETVLSPTDIVYIREASSLSSPVSAGAIDYVLIDWVNPNYPSRSLHITELGTDQHDNSVYKWMIDGYNLPLSGRAAAGTIMKPFVFKDPIVVLESIQLLITNNNGVDYPNSSGSGLLDKIPYEGVVVGNWGW